MPTYEFRCQVCRKRFEKVLSYQQYGAVKVNCPHCSSDQVTRLIGRIRVKRNSIDHLTELADPKNLDRIEEDPKAMGRMMREMESGIGVDMGGEFNEVVDRLERGQTPDEIDQAFPDIASEE